MEVSGITVNYAIKKGANCDQGSKAALDKLEGWRGFLGLWRSSLCMLWLKSQQ